MFYHTVWWIEEVCVLLCGGDISRCQSYNPRGFLLLQVTDKTSQGRSCSWDPPSPPPSAAEPGGCVGGARMVPGRASKMQCPLGPALDILLLTSSSLGGSRRSLWVILRRRRKRSSVPRHRRCCPRPSSSPGPCSSTGARPRLDLRPQCASWWGNLCSSARGSRAKLWGSSWPVPTERALHW